MCMLTCMLPAHNLQVVESFLRSLLPHQLLFSRFAEKNIEVNKIMVWNANQYATENNACDSDDNNNNYDDKNNGVELQSYNQ